MTTTEEEEKKAPDGDEVVANINGELGVWGVVSRCNII